MSVASVMAARVHTLRGLIPGVCLALVLAVCAQLTSQEVGSWFSHEGAAAISPVFFAVLLGILWRNLVGVGRRAEMGLQWVMQSLLRFGIALVGLRLTLAGVSGVGAIALPVVVSCIFVALVASHALGRMLGLAAPLRHLIFAGTAICGCTAVMAAAPAARARPEEIGLALTCVVLFGCAGMVAYPWIADALFGSNATAAGIFLGTAIHDTSQVVGASLIFAQQSGAEEAVAVAGVTKLLRNVSILVLVPYIAWMSQSASSDPAKRGVESVGIGGTSLQRSQVFPAFVIWFVALVFVRTAGDAFIGESSQLGASWAWLLDTAASISAPLLICGMTAVGLSISLKQMKSLGWRPVCVAMTTAAAVAGCSLALTLLVASAA